MLYELPTSRLRWFISLQAAPPSALPNYYSGILIPPERERDNATHMILTGITLTASIAFSAGAPALPLAVATLVGVVKDSEKVPRRGEHERCRRSRTAKEL